MIVTDRVFLTADRKRLVFEGDPDAAFLAYTRGDEVGDLAAAEVGLDRLYATKQRTATAENKARRGSPRQQEVGP